MTSSGDEREAVEIYSATHRLLDLSGAWIAADSENNLCFRSVWSQHDPAVTESRIHLQKFFTADGTALPSVPTTKHGLVAYYRTAKGEATPCNAHLYTYGDDKKSCLDVWGADGVEKRFDLSGCDVHGVIYTDAEFSSLSWSLDGTKLVYVAERKVPKSASFFAQHNKPETVPGGVYDYAESWGEQLETCCSSVLCVLDISTGAVHVLNTPDHVFPAKPVWSGDNTIYFIGFDASSMKHGAIYCWNRDSQLYSYNMTSEVATAHTPKGQCVYMPCPEIGDKGRVVYLTCKSGGAHRKYMEIAMFYDSTHLVKPTVDAVVVPGGFTRTVPDSLFYGNFSPAPWVDADHVIAVSSEGTCTYIIKINVTDGTKTKLFDGAFGHPDGMCCSPRDQIGGKLLIQFSHLNPFSDTYKQGLAYADLNDPDTPVKQLVKPKCSASVKCCKYTIMAFNRDGRDYNGVLIQPKTGNLDHKTLIIFPHGGPHSVFTTAFRHDTYTLAQLGYTSLLVNYTGSLGLGAESVAALPGHVGDMDVKDVQHAAEQVAAGGYTKVVVMGGSHGGFLTAHLIGQYPDFYSAAVMRNPVIDISAMVGVSDIPDWCYFEAGIDYSTSRPPVPTAGAITAMLAASPIRYLDQVTCPALLMIGAKDLRVPPSQGIRYYRYLKSRGVKCDLKLYKEDCHPLAGVPCAADVLIHTHLWFKKHLNI